MKVGADHDKVRQHHVLHFRCVRVWEWKVAERERQEKEQEFFVRLFETEAFKLLYGPDFDIGPFAKHAKPLALGTFKSVLHPDFNQWIRQLILEDTGKLCCDLFLEYGGLSTDTDIDTFISLSEN